MNYRDEWKKDIDGHDAIRSLHEELRQEIGRRWNRSVPFADEIFDRWERASHLGFGSGASIYDSSVVLGNVEVGVETWIGPFTVLDGTGGLRIGKSCSVSAGVQIYTHDTIAWAVTGGTASSETGPVTIGNFTYIGPNSIVTRDVRVGSRCVIGAGSLINNDVPDNSIVFGIPGRKVGEVEVDGRHVELRYND